MSQTQRPEVRPGRCSSPSPPSGWVYSSHPSWCQTAQREKIEHAMVALEAMGRFLCRGEEAWTISFQDTSCRTPMSCHPVNPDRGPPSPISFRFSTISNIVVNLQSRHLKIESWLPQIEGHAWFYPRLRTKSPHSKGLDEAQPMFCRQCGHPLS